MVVDPRHNKTPRLRRDRIFQMPRHHSHFGSPKKTCDAPPTYTRHHKTQHKTKQCVSTPIPLSARHGRPTTRRRIWHASRTRRSVSNIIGSVPNGKRRWGGLRYSLIPLDHPPVHGPDAHRSVPPAIIEHVFYRTSYRSYRYGYFRRRYIYVNGPHGYLICSTINGLLP